MNGTEVVPNQSSQEGPVSMEMLKYKEELAEKMGLPSPYGMTLLKQYCTDLVASGMVPSYFSNNPMAVYAAAMRGREMDLAPTESVMETFWPAPGNKLGMFANKMLDIMHRRAVKSKFIREDKDGCEILFTPPNGHEPYTAKFEMAEAVAAKLVKPDSNYQKWPSDMCKARAIARGWRALAGTFKGSANIYAKEELEDETSTTAPPSDADRTRMEQLENKYKVAVKEPAKVIEMQPPTPEPPTPDVPPVAAAPEPPAPTPAPAPPAAAAPPMPTPEPPKPVETSNIVTSAPPSPAPATNGERKPDEPLRKHLSAVVQAILDSPAAKAKKMGLPDARAVIQSFLCGFFAVDTTKQLPIDYPAYTNALPDFEMVLANDPSSVIGKPKATGAVMAGWEQEYRAILGKTKWPAELCLLARQLARLWGHAPDDFSTFIESQELDFTAPENAAAYFRLALKTREAGKLWKLCRQKELWMGEQVKAIEEDIGPLVDAEPKAVERAIDALIAKIGAPAKRNRKAAAAEPEAVPEPPASEEGEIGLFEDVQ